MQFSDLSYSCFTNPKPSKNKLKYFIVMSIQQKTIKLQKFNRFISMWCHQESNRGHKDFQSFALPTELWHHRFAELRVQR